LLKANNIHKVYNSGKKELRVLKGINLNIERGKFAAIVGPSGAGKSTLLHILGGLDSPDKGSVFFEQQDIYALVDKEIARIRNTRIGFVFQFYHLLSEFNVLENVLMPALIDYALPVTHCQLRSRALQLLERVGLSDRINHFPSQLSGGEKQRVAIVRGLINNPMMLLCDEPTGNLDSKTGEEIISLIKKINLDDKMAVILVTHNIELTKTADSVYHLEDGILA
jgi:lipoprotein-releasing system ATP-binding protein